MHRISEKEIQALESLRDDINRLDNQSSNIEIVKIDYQFHSILYNASKNRQLACLLDKMLSNYLRFWLSFKTIIKMDTFFSQAFDIMKAIENKDEIRLRAASVQHIRISLDEIMGVPSLVSS
jgi:DNA-binding GntR family transcriptional regulator